MTLQDRLTSDLSQCVHDLSEAQERCHQLQWKVDYIRELLSSENSLAKDETPRVVVRPRREPRAAPTETDSQRSYLGEIRRAIATLPEPFTKSHARAAMLTENTDWTEKELSPHIHNGFAYLEKQGKIQRDSSQNMASLGEVLWLRAETFTIEASSAPNRCPLVEPSTGKTWKSVQDFIREIGLSEPHKVYRAIAAGEPLENGQLIQYVRRQRRAGEAFTESAEPKSEVPRERPVFPSADAGTVENVPSDPLIRIAV